MPRPLPWLLLVGYLALALGVFACLFAWPASDDYAGWSLAIAGSVLPVWIVLALRRGPLGSLAGLTLALPAALGLTGVAASLLLLVHLPDLTMGPLLMFGTPALALALAVVILRRIRRLPAQDAARRVAVVVAAPASFALTLALLVGGGTLTTIDPTRELSFEQGLALAQLLLDALPLLWALGIAAAWAATRAPPRHGASPPDR